MCSAVSPALSHFRLPIRSPQHPSLHFEQPRTSQQVVACRGLATVLFRSPIDLTVPPELRATGHLVLLQWNRMQNEFDTLLLAVLQKEAGGALAVNDL